MILKAAWVVPVVGSPIQDGFVEIVADRIVRVGAVSELSLSFTETVDLGEAVLLPGFVNPHTHLEMTGYAGTVPPTDFWPWIGKMIVLRAAPGMLDREQAGVREGARLSLRAGVTCIGDISRTNLAWPVLKNIPIRKVCFAELLSVADLPPRDPAELRRIAEEVAEDELLTVGFSPHAPYTVPRGQIRGAFELAAELGRPWTMHLAETREEVAFLRGEANALNPMFAKLLAERGVHSPRCLPGELLAECAAGCGSGSVAHGNYLTEREYARLAEQGHVVMYCPRSHHFFGHSPHPFAAMRRAGVTVALGTDSLASNQSLSMLDEMHFVHAQIANPPEPNELLRMATLDAARALNLEEQIGSLEAGKQADLGAFAMPAGVSDPVRHLIENPGEAQAVWIAGRRVK